MLIISLSNIMNIAGNTNTTTRKLIIAPLANNTQSELIISMLEYIPTPNVAAKKLSALTNTYWIEPLSADVIASFLPAPLYLAFLYLLVISIA